MVNLTRTILYIVCLNTITTIDHFNNNRLNTKYRMRHKPEDRNTACALFAGACPEDEKPVSNVHRSACVPACSLEHSLCHQGTCICRQGFEGTYLRGQLQHCELIPLDVRQTGKPL